MRLSAVLRIPAWRRVFSSSLVVLAIAPWAMATPVRGQAPAPERDPEDILGELVVDAAKAGPGRLVLPVVAVESPLTETPLQARVREVVTRDLELSGEVEVVPASHAAVRPEHADVPLDPEPWREAKVEIVVRVHADRIPVGQVGLWAEIHLLRAGQGPLRSEVDGALSAERLTSHRLADAVLGTITGYEGPFASRLSFVRSAAGERTVLTIDPDGHGASPRSPADQLATAPAFDPEGTLYWAGSVHGGRYRLYRERQAEAIPLEPAGSIYGLAFDGRGDRAAVAIATATGIQLFVGSADLRGLEASTELPLALHPAFSSRGALAYAGTARTRQRIYVDRRPVSPKGLTASAPAFCRHPDGERLVYSVGVRERADLLVTDAKGRDPLRITKGQGRNSHPACSPDGRLVAFFSTRRTGEGPGLYVMRIDGRRPRKISSMLGDSLQWSGRLGVPMARSKAAAPVAVSPAEAATDEAEAAATGEVEAEATPEG